MTDILLPPELRTIDPANTVNIGETALASTLEASADEKTVAAILKLSSLAIEADSAEDQLAESRWSDVDLESGIVMHYSATQSVSSQNALRLEHEIWEKKGYGNEIEAYAKYESQSRVFVAEKDGDAVGIVRVFKGSPELPPFMGLPIDDDKVRTQLEAECLRGEIEELGTVAVDHTLAPTGRISTGLWRLAYRDAIDRGIQKWGIIMEPRRVAAMNKRYGFTFEQIGVTQFYQGGECAVHTMDLKKVCDNMAVVTPGILDWFVEQPLNKITK